MAWWTKSAKNVFSKFEGGIKKVPFVYSLIKQSEDRQEFYELEIAEVERVILDLQDFIDNNLVLADNKTPDFSYLGAVKARLVYSQQNVKVEELKWIFPLDSNIKQYPLVHEYVIVANYLGKSYYTQKVNIRNSVSQNVVPGLSALFKGFSKFDDPNEPEDRLFIQKLGKNFYDYFHRIRQLTPEEGDLSIQGRFGNTIRLSSNIVKGNTTENKRKYKHSPNIKIRAGQLTDLQMFGKRALGRMKPLVDNHNLPCKENINFDGSSMWMTTNEEINLTPAALWDSDLWYGKSLSILGLPVPTWKGKQIILNSGGITFNSKYDKLYGFSGGGMYFNTPRKFIVDAEQKILFNSNRIELGISAPGAKASGMIAYEQALLGKATVMTLTEVLKALWKHMNMTVEAPQVKEGEPDPLVGSAKNVKRVIEKTIVDLQGGFPDAKRTTLQGYPLDSKCLSDVVFMSPKSVSPERKKAMSPEVPVVNEGLDLDDLWDNTMWEEIEEVTTKEYEVENITAPGGVRG